MSRPTRDQYFMGIAEATSKRSTCPRFQNGAVIVELGYNRILSTGFNGSIPGAPHCIDVGCWEVHNRERVRCIRTVHAEANAIIRMGGISLGTDRIIYTLALPCFECYKLIAAVGIREVVYKDDYQDEYRDYLILLMDKERIFHPQLRRL